MPDAHPGTRLRPVIRVFVSSTFSDMRHERNALQEQVYPKLEHLCLRNGFQFQAIDLRWGVSSEAGLDHRTMRICLDELRRAQEISPLPNFLILLGNRYGWRPLPETVPAEEFDQLHRMARAAGAESAKVLQSWYRRDDNASPPVFLLQSRRQDLRDGKDYTQDAPWSRVQAALWEIINRAYSPSQLQGRFEAARRAHSAMPAVVRFQASATEQEIWHGALGVPDARDHVLACFREIGNAGEFGDPSQLRDFLDLTPSGGVDTALQAEQERLKAELRNCLGRGNVLRCLPARLVTVRARDGRRAVDVTTDHVAPLCAGVERRLTEIIRGQIAAYWRGTGQASVERAARDLEIEQREHERFGRERGDEAAFVGRQAELKAIRDHIQSDSPWPLVVHGASGCGKTALLANAALDLSRSALRTPRSAVVARFIGVTPRASDLRGILGSLCQELRQLWPRAEALPTDVKLLEAELLEQFAAASPGQPLVLFLDALDQLADTDGGRLLHWLPVGPLPAHVKLVVSCLSDRAAGDPAGQPYAELRRRNLPATHFINLDALSDPDAKALLFERWLPRAGRTVSREQRAQVERRLASPACRQPIYLKLLFEEARQWRSYDAPPDLGEDVPGLLHQLFERLRQPANHGPLLVNRVLGYLAASREGLSETEILEILFSDPEYKAALDQAAQDNRHEMPPNTTRIPVAIWSRLRFDLASYLTERAAVGSSVLTFYHRQVAEWVQTHTALGDGTNWLPHARLADYFQRAADPGGTRNWAGDSARPFLQLAYHLSGARQWERLSRVLSDLRFIEVRCRWNQAFDLVRDCDQANELEPLPGVCLVRRALALSLPGVVDRPSLAAALVYSRLKWMPQASAVLPEALARAEDRLRTLPYWLCATAPIPEGGGSGELAVAYPFETGHQAVIRDGAAIVLVAHDGRVELRNLQVGNTVETRHLGHAPIAAIAADGTGARLVFLDGRGNVRAERSRSVLRGREGEHLLAIHPQFGVVAVRDDNSLVAWNPDADAAVVLATDLPAPMTTIRVRSGGRYMLVVLGDHQQEILLIEQAQGRPAVRRLPHPGVPVCSADLSEDGAHVLYATLDRRLSVVRTGASRPIAERRYQADPGPTVNGVPLLCVLGCGEADGQACLATLDGQMACWDYRSGSFKKLPDYRRAAEPGLLVLLETLPPEGRFFVSMGTHGWGVAREEAGAPRTAHAAPVSGCFVARDGVVCSLSRMDQTVRWFSAEGGSPLFDVQHVREPAAIAPDGDGAEALMANRVGVIWTLPPAPPLPKDSLRQLFAEPVVSLFRDRDGSIVGAGASGAVKRIRPSDGEGRSLCSGSGMRTQRKIAPGDAGSVWSLYDLCGDKGTLKVVALLDAHSGKETKILSEPEHVSDIAVGGDGQRLCVAGRRVRVFEGTGGSWRERFSRDTAVSHACFLAASSLLALILEAEPWLEIWRVSPGLPTVTAMPLPSDPTCLGVRGDRIAVGCASGDLVFLRLSGAEFSVSAKQQEKGLQ